MKYRLSQELHYVILQKCRTPQLITHVMNAASTNYAMLTVHLSYLIEKNLLRKVDPFPEDPNCVYARYETTGKGKDWLGLYDTLAEFTKNVSDLEQKKDIVQYSS